ncbi:MAG: hypothetical protein HOB73_02740 [Planctomycetaceae bacterium]|nr:hypothetical protein [Planctomycetaceae bacterium]
MAWQEINGHRYYYRSTNTDGIITTEYFGRGTDAELAALADTSANNKRLQLDQEDQRYIDQLSEDLHTHNRVQWWIERLARADGLLAGFIRHNRGSEWRETNAD